MYYTILDYVILYIYSASRTRRDRISPSLPPSLSLSIKNPSLARAVEALPLSRDRISPSLPLDRISLCPQRCLCMQAADGSPAHTDRPRRPATGRGWRRIILYFIIVYYPSPSISAHTDRPRRPAAMAMPTCTTDERESPSLSRKKEAPSTVDRPRWCRIILCYVILYYIILYYIILLYIYSARRHRRPPTGRDGHGAPLQARCRNPSRPLQGTHTDPQ